MCKQLNANTYYDLDEKRVYNIKKIFAKKKKHIKNFNVIERWRSHSEILPLSTFRITFTVEMNILCAIMG